LGDKSTVKLPRLRAPLNYGYNQLYNLKKKKLKTTAWYRFTKELTQNVKLRNHALILFTLKPLIVSTAFVTVRKYI